MAMTALEFDVKEKLEGVGFTFHNEGGRCWFMWMGPDDKWTDAQVGPDCSSPQDAIRSAHDALTATQGGKTDGH